jgi:hypothetical protein
MATATTINNKWQQKKWRRWLLQRRWRQMVVTAVEIVVATTAVAVTIAAKFPPQPPPFLPQPLTRHG